MPYTCGYMDRECNKGESVELVDMKYVEIIYWKTIETIWGSP